MPAKALTWTVGQTCVQERKKAERDRLAIGGP